MGAGTFGASLAGGAHLRRFARLVARASGRAGHLVDQFEPGDSRASSGGETRLFLCAYGPDAEYAAMARRARTLWRELEEESGQDLLAECGMAWFAHREDGWEAASERTLAAQAILVERIDVERATQLYPSFRGDDLAFVLLEPEGGVLRAERAVRALATQATAHGARIIRSRAPPRIRQDLRQFEVGRLALASLGWLRRSAHYYRWIEPVRADGKARPLRCARSPFAAPPAAPSSPTARRPAESRRFPSSRLGGADEPLAVSRRRGQAGERSLMSIFPSRSRTSYAG